MQRIILRDLKASVHRLQGLPSPELNRYYHAYKREFRNYQKISDKTELLRAVKETDVVFGGDFHPFAQSQRTHLRILREIVKGRRPVKLLLEAVDSQHQKYVDKFLDGRIDDRTFLRKVNYSHSWGFPWENYKVLFEFAKTHRIPIIGINRSRLNGSDDLGRRDEFSAECIARVREDHPDALLYVVYGDLHLASSHLPRLTRKAIGNRVSTRFLTVFQNSETLYFRLAKRNLEERVDVLKLRSDAYCVVNSPPWLKWQAYLNFLERHLEHDAGDEYQSLDYNDHINGLVKMIQRIWDVTGNFSDFHVFLQGDGGVVEHLAKSTPSKDLTRVITMIKSGRSLFVPFPPTFYLRAFEINYAAELAGQYIHAKLRRERKMHLTFPNDFLPLIWVEAVGFFASQVINSRRKFVNIKDLPPNKVTTVLVLEQRLLEQLALKTNQTLRQVKKHRTRRTQDYILASRTVGALLGNKIYTAFHSGDLDFDTLHRWLRTPVVAGPRFSRFYLSILAALKKVKVDERHQNERL